MNSKEAGHNLQIVHKGKGVELFLDGFKLMHVIDYKLTAKPKDCELTVVLDINEGFSCRTVSDTE